MSYGKLGFFSFYLCKTFYVENRIIKSKDPPSTVQLRGQTLKETVHLPHFSSLTHSTFKPVVSISIINPLVHEYHTCLPLNSIDRLSYVGVLPA